MKRGVASSAAGGALLLLFGASAQAQDTTAGAASAAGAFYALSLSQPHGIPDSAARARFAPFLSARLNAQLAAAAGAEARFKAKNKDSPPLLEGDIFSSLFEGPTAYKLGACRGDDRIQRCSVGLTHQETGKTPITWTDTLVLTNQGGWKVDDIAYDANFTSGNTGTLTETLKMAAAEVP